MHLDEDETELCNFLSEALLMRQPVFLSESHALARRFSDLGLQLGGVGIEGILLCEPGFMAQGDYTLMLYKVGDVPFGKLVSRRAPWSPPWTWVEA